MKKEELDRYRIRDYYMIPTEIVDNVFYEFETQLKKQKEIIDQVKKIIGEELLTYDNESDEYLVGMKLLQILEDKEV